jgi:hypothetical protein
MGVSDTGNNQLHENSIKGGLVMLNLKNKAERKGVI